MGILHTREAHTANCDEGLAMIWREFEGRKERALFQSEKSVCFTWCICQDHTRTSGHRTV